jgi:hypothetical protein
MPAKPNVSFASAVASSVVAKSAKKHASSNSFDQDLQELDLNEYQLRERDHWETKSDDTAATSEMDDTKKQLEELQIRTIFSLVEPLEIEFDSKTMKKKLLFITNKQARKFDFTNMTHFLQALDITPRPQLVINLMPSCWRSGTYANCLYGEDDVTRERLVELNMYTEFDKAGLDKSFLNARNVFFARMCSGACAAPAFDHGISCALRGGLLGPAATATDPLLTSCPLPVPSCPLPVPSRALHCSRCA